MASATSISQSGRFVIDLEDDLPAQMVAQTLGHSSLEMTLSRYATYIPEAMSEQHRKLAHLFGTQRTSDDRAMHGIAPTDTKSDAFATTLDKTQGDDPNSAAGEIT